jgi:hypothetical protein
LAKDSFNALSSYIGNDDYDTLGGTAMDMARDFSKKTTKTYVNDSVFSNILKQVDSIKQECTKNEKMLEEQLQKIR